MRLSLAVRVWGAVLVLVALVMGLIVLSSGRLQALEGQDE